MEQEKHKVPYYIPGAFKNMQQNEIFQDIDQRLSLIEEKVFKKVKRLRATEAQKFLILYHLGLIAPIRQLPISQNKKDLLVSVMLDINEDTNWLSRRVYHPIEGA
jgi:hypothetical protein